MPANAQRKADAMIEQQRLRTHARGGACYAAPPPAAHLCSLLANACQRSVRSLRSKADAKLVGVDDFRLEPALPHNLLALACHAAQVCVGRS